MVFGGLRECYKMSCDRLGGSRKYLRKARGEVLYVAWCKGAEWEERMEQVIIIIERKKEGGDRSLYTVVTNSKNRWQVVA